MVMNHTDKNHKTSLNDLYLCAFYNQPCIHQSSGTVMTSHPEAKKFSSPYKDIIKCLRCPTLKANISSNPRLYSFFVALGNHYLTLLQKLELDQMILNKQRFSLENMQRETEDHKIEKNRQERALKNRINKYESQLAKMDVYLNTLQSLCTIVGQIPDPDTMWKRASVLLTTKLLDLEAVGLLLLDKNCCMIKRRFTSLLPSKLSGFIDDCLDQKGLSSSFTNNKNYLSLYQIYWEGRHIKKRLGPRTEEMLERCLLFPIKEHYTLAGIFIVLMKNLSSSTEELAPFFFTAARLIEEGIISVS